jgi:hypothetical protein
VERGARLAALFFFFPRSTILSKRSSEFHLVAGGEELFLETGLLAPVKSEESCDTSSLIPFDESDCVSPITPSTPSFSPTEFIYEHQSGSTVPSPPTFHSSTYSAKFSDSPKESTHVDAFVVTQDVPYAPSPLTPVSPPPQLQDDQFKPQAAQPTPSPSPPPSRRRVQSDTIVEPSRPLSSPTSPSHSGVLSYLGRRPINRICFLSLWADGMQPFTIPIQHQSGLPVTLRIRLRLSSIDDVHSPPTLHGFHGAVTLSAPWTSTAHCITKVYPNNICVAEETGLLQVLSTNSSQPGGSQTVQAFLPESPLSRSRWLDASKRQLPYMS